ncbi:hypothetical protein WAI453_008943 [Rhynchosporium graminicola]
MHDIQDIKRESSQDGSESAIGNSSNLDMPSLKATRKSDRSKKKVLACPLIISEVLHKAQLQRSQQETTQERQDTRRRLSLLRSQQSEQTTNRRLSRDIVNHDPVGRHTKLKLLNGQRDCGGNGEGSASKETAMRNEFTEGMKNIFQGTDRKE